MTHVQEIIASDLCIIPPTFVAHMFPRPMYSLKSSVYSGILMCSRACMTVKTRRTKLLVVCREDCRWRQVDEAQTHGINRLSLLRQWSCSGLKLATAPVWNNWWADRTAVLWHSYWHRHDSACMLIVGCWAVQCSSTSNNWLNYCSVHPCRQACTLQ